MVPGYINTLQIPYTSHDFPNGTVADTGVLNTNWSELIWAALTVGRPNMAYVLAHGDASYYEAMFRLSLVWMALEQCPCCGWLKRTDAFRSLDPTEKGAVSYFLGLAICKLFASHLLDTPWLLHLDVFRNQLDPLLLGGRSRPDLVGQNMMGKWHAFECKGRSTVPSAEDKRKAKEQAERLVFVDQVRCSLHVGAISFFRQDMLEFYWRDPNPKDEEKSESIQVSVQAGDWRHYYKPALALSVTNEMNAQMEGRADVDIKIHHALRDSLLAEEWIEIRPRVRELASELADDGYRPDGLKVLAGESWSQERGR